MGLISKTAIMRWNANNKKWYTERGYIYTTMKDEFEVKVEDLPHGSKCVVEVKCDGDNCEKTSKISYGEYSRWVHKGGIYYCKACGTRIIASKNARKTKLSKSKSFEQWCIENNEQDILSRWDYELNEFLPSEVSYSTQIKCWFKCGCNNNHKSELKNIGSFTQGYEGSMDCYQCNSVGQYILDNYGQDFLNKVWNWELNKTSPFKYGKRSREKVWWNCIDSNHETYFRNINSSNQCDFRCPQCSLHIHQSQLQEKVNKYLVSLNYNVLHEFKCTLVVRNPKTNRILPYDNEIIIGNRCLLIEVMGKQHYEISSWDVLASKQNNTTPKYELHFKQLKDRYKRIKCIQNGYEYLAIPYWTEEDEFYKELINSKINEIMEGSDIKNVV